MIAIICITIIFSLIILRSIIKIVQENKTERKIEQLSFERELPQNNCEHDMNVLSTTETNHKKTAVFGKDVIEREWREIHHTLCCKKCGFIKYT